MDLIGIPWQIRIGPKSLKNNCVGLKQRNKNDEVEINISNIVNEVRKKIVKQ